MSHQAKSERSAAAISSATIRCHGISGNLQLAVSSWVFTAVFFAAAIVTSLALYGRMGARHV